MNSAACSYGWPTTAIAWSQRIPVCGKSRAELSGLAVGTQPPRIKPHRSADRCGLLRRRPQLRSRGPGLEGSSIERKAGGSASSCGWWRRSRSLGLGVDREEYPHNRQPYSGSTKTCFLACNSLRKFPKKAFLGRCGQFIPLVTICNSGKKNIMLQQRDILGAIVLGSDFKALGVVRSLGRQGIPSVVIANQRCSAWFSRYVVKRFKGMAQWIVVIL